MVDSRSRYALFQWSGWLRLLGCVPRKTSKEASLRMPWCAGKAGDPRRVNRLFFLILAASSTGGAAVSKTAGWRFESFAVSQFDR